MPQTHGGDVMRNRPNAAELLNIAEKTMADEIAPDLSNRQRYNIAMVMSAMGIARREMEGGPSPCPDELSVLRRLYGGAEGGDSATALERLNRRFAGDLRSGVYDPKSRRHRAAMDLLRRDVLARLAEDNPRYEK